MVWTELAHSSRHPHGDPKHATAASFPVPLTIYPVTAPRRREP